MLLGLLQKNSKQFSFKSSNALLVFTVQGCNVFSLHHIPRARSVRPTSHDQAGCGIISPSVYGRYFCLFGMILKAHVGKHSLVRSYVCFVLLNFYCSFVKDESFFSSNTVHYLDHEVGQFRTNEFLETVTGYDLPFYVKVTI